MSRKRGAQLGNKNAYKHGFYSAQFKSNERRILSQMSLADLSGEIELIRVSNKRLMEALNGSSEFPDLDTQMSVLRAITLSAESINSMIRTQMMLARTNRESDEIMAKLMELSKEEGEKTEAAALEE